MSYKRTGRSFSSCSTRSVSVTVGYRTCFPHSSGTPYKFPLLPHRRSHCTCRFSMCKVSQSPPPSARVPHLCSSLRKATPRPLQRPQVCCATYLLYKTSKDHCIDALLNTLNAHQHAEHTLVHKLAHTRTHTHTHAHTHVSTYTTYTGAEGLPHAAALRALDLLSPQGTPLGVARISCRLTHYGSNVQALSGVGGIPSRRPASAPSAAEPVTVPAERGEFGGHAVSTSAASNTRAVRPGTAQRPRQPPALFYAHGGGDEVRVQRPPPAPVAPAPPRTAWGHAAAQVFACVSASVWLVCVCMYVCE